MAILTIDELKARNPAEYIKRLEEALKPFANAYLRMHYFGAEPSDDSSMQIIDEEGCSWELFAIGGEHLSTEPSVLLTAGHLSNAVAALESKYTPNQIWPEAWDKFDQEKK